MHNGCFLWQLFQTELQVLGLTQWICIGMCIKWKQIKIQTNYPMLIVLLGIKKDKYVVNQRAEEKDVPSGVFKDSWFPIISGYSEVTGKRERSNFLIKKTTKMKANVNNKHEVAQERGNDCELQMKVN